MALRNIWFGLVLDFVCVILLYSIHFFFECLVISFIYLFLAVLGLPCYAGFSLAVASGLLTAAASLVASTGPRAHRLP